ncbi:type 2 lanthipeptide synthetase LanM family protein [Leptolyngbya sp. NIES-2104]|uniref:type 2 lanthipeptide synthetase LanM family protein n=1 Tax=Leptolyngbya sp. NIES-2104 TaxID=1552121 RepID=UPI0006EC8CC8|nr:type 2 lanthipeptide synthetase LanM family protein [Leptolyngbya sp. NIES-2104]GAP94813.1 lanthionine biosynthesis protein LanM [Leptolyngbya sp. NIES-2104]
MQITQEDLIKIVEQASTIPERLGTEFLPNSMQIDNSTIDSRIDHWCQTVAQGNPAQFEKRLTWDDLDLSKIRQALGSVHLANPQNLPAWAETLRAVLESIDLDSVLALDKNLLEEKYPLDAKQPLPFEELSLPFIDFARQTLMARSGFNYFLLSAESHATLERSLLQSLTLLCSQAMGDDFLVFRLYEQPCLIRQIGQLEGSHSTEQYDKFIRKMLAGELLNFFQEYAVLARLVATLTDFWVNHFSEFLQRLASDWSNIQVTFQGGAELGQVVSIQPGLSDAHHNGRSVIKLTFASGLKLIYKPKDLGLEEAYFQLVSWLNENGIPQPLKVLQLINCSGYGWVEYVEHCPCPDQAAVARYYQRAGMLLCLLYSLSGTDFHQENIIACGEHPVPIDLEMLMSAVARQEESSEITANAVSMAFDQFTYSVLSTSLLPSWELGRDGVAYDMSGLGGFGDQPTNFHRLVWRNINTDGMVLHREDVKTRSCSNVVILNGVRVSLSDYAEELVEGFRQMYQFLIAHQDTLLAANSSLIVLAHQRVRSIFRATQVYTSLLAETLQPKFLRDGAERSIALDVLSKSLLKYEKKPNSWKIVAAEQQALTHLDIPFFSTHPDRYDLTISADQSVKHYFVESSYDHIVTRFRQLNETDLAQQIGFIRSSLYTNFAGNFASPLSEKPILNLDAIEPIAKKTLIQQAEAIALELQTRAICAPDGSVTWIGMSYLPEAERLQQMPMGYDLYDGTFGVALFLSALEKVTGNGKFHRLALGALQPLFNLLQISNPLHKQAILRKIGVGGGKGFGSILYTLVRSSQFLAEPMLLNEAQSIASVIIPELIANDRKFDVISGTAGTILGLLALHQATFNPAVLEQAVLCGYHLLNHRTVSDRGLKAWKTLNGEVLTGFSHGAAGIAYSLLRLYEVTQNAEFLAAATEAIADEQSAFRETSEFATSWCNGAPGIGLARLGSLAILETDEIRQEIAIALQTTQKLGIQDIDHLCCGNFGRIETLLVGAIQLKQPELAEIAQKQAAWIVTRAINTGSFQLFPKLFRGIYNPGFFQGSAGIGYELLRLAHPEQLPSVLLWQ